MINIAAALNRIQAAKFEKPLILFHGTSSKFLKSILTNGLTPSSKEGRWIGEDDGASESSRSRASYGGIYFTNNFGTATSAATNLITHKESYNNRTSNILIVCAQIQPSSTIGDEDDYKFNLFNAQNISDSLIPNILAMYRSNIKYSGGYDSARFNKQAFDAVQSNVDYLLNRYAPELKSRDDANKLVGLAREVVLTELERKAAYRSVQSGTKPYYSYDNDAKKAVNRINYHKGGLPYGEPLPQKMRPFSKQKAEMRARQALDLFVQATKNYSKSNLESQRYATYTRGTARIMDVVRFRGRNKITCIIELVQSKTEKYGSDIVLHYGVIPDELKRQYVQTKGPWPQVFDKTGEKVESAVKKTPIPDNLPEQDTCAIYSIACVTDKTPEEVWTFARQYWRDGGRLKAGLTPINQYRILKDMGYFTQNDYSYFKYDNKSMKMKTKTFGQALEVLKKQPRYLGFLILLPNHVVGVKTGKVIDTANTGLKTKVRGITIVTTDEMENKPIFEWPEIKPTVFKIQSSLSQIRVSLIGKPEKITEPFNNITNTIYKFYIYKDGEVMNCRLTIIVSSNEPDIGYMIIDGEEKNNLGTSGMREVLRSVKRKYPKLAKLQGTRISGAKRLSGKIDKSVVYDLSKAALIV